LLFEFFGRLILLVRCSYLDVVRERDDGPGAAAGRHHRHRRRARA